MQVQQGSPVGKHWIDVDFLNVGEVRHRVFWEFEIPDMFDGAIVSVNPLQLGENLVESVSALPHFLEPF